MYTKVQATSCSCGPSGSWAGPRPERPETVASAVVYLLKQYLQKPLVRRQQPLEEVRTSSRPTPCEDVGNRLCSASRRWRQDESSDGAPHLWAWVRQPRTPSAPHPPSLAHELIAAVRADVGARRRPSRSSTSGSGGLDTQVEDRSAPAHACPSLRSRSGSRRLPSADVAPTAFAARARPSPVRQITGSFRRPPTGGPYLAFRHQVPCTRTAAT